jgi:ribA/ribD-fused uncharacterized protein
MASDPMRIWEASDGEEMPRNVNELCQLERRGCCPDFLFFYGNRPSNAGSSGPGFLSQWWSAPFSVRGKHYPTAEHFMMVRKAELFEDEIMASRILADSSPAAAKTLGRAVRGYDEEIWAVNRYGIVLEGNLAKFGQSPVLQAYLAATAGRVLVEASPTDRVWGIGLAADDSTSTRSEVAEIFAGRTGYVYGISTRGLPGVAVNDVLGTTWRYAWQQEVAIPGGIPWENVRSYYPSPVWKSL